MLKKSNLIIQTPEFYLYVLLILGSRENTCATGTIIGPSEAVFIGGLPTDFVIRREDTNVRVKVRRKALKSS